MNGIGPLEIALLVVPVGIVIAAVFAVVIVISVRRRGGQQATQASTPKFCLNCGKPLEMKGSFCIQCGAAINSSQVSEVPNTGSRSPAVASGVAKHEQLSDSGALRAQEPSGLKTIPAQEEEPPAERPGESNVGRDTVTGPPVQKSNRHLQLWMLSAVIVVAVVVAFLAIYLTGKHGAPTTTSGPPPAPSNVAVTAIDATHIRVSWTDNSGGQASFYVTDAGPLSASVPARTTTHTFSGVTPNSYHCFTIRAINSAGNSAWTTYVCTTTPAL
jgi:hypothetical protein